jgi:hypothetical protein
MGHYTVSYGATVWNADSVFPLLAQASVYRTGVLLEESKTQAVVAPGSMRTVLANSFGLDIAGTWPVQLRCEKISGNGSFQAQNIQLTAIRVESLN